MKIVAILVCATCQGQHTLAGQTKLAPHKKMHNYILISLSRSPQLKP